MLSISINFDYPYLLLLIIPLVLATFIPYFMISKRYRNTRNRWVSIICHILASILAVLMLTGMTIVNTNSNPNNEIILLVDSSDSTTDRKNDINDFVDIVVSDARYDKFKIGIVKFGFDQVYAVPLTNDYDSISKKYREAADPDTSATDIAAALVYAKTLFTNPNSGKIVLATDGVETDEVAKSVIRTVVASGIKLDVAYFGALNKDYIDLEVTEMILPDYHINVDDKVTISAEIKGNYDGQVTARLYDNDKIVDSENFTINSGVSKIDMHHSFKTEGLHSLSIKFEVKDKIINNNEYTTYLYLEQYNNILIIEQQAGSSSVLKEILETDKLFNVTILNTKTDDLPTTAQDLCKYDEIITNNIANSDLTEEFVSALDEYVSVYGGGLFTVGGSDSTGEAHAYDRADMAGSNYQKILPVQAIDYTPPVGVIVIIDRSGSMGSKDAYGDDLLAWARSGAAACLTALTERDYMGVMTLDSYDNTIIEPTPRTQEAKILSAINSITEATGGTVFASAIDSAGQQLRALKQVDKKHIIIVSDGLVSKEDIALSEEYAKNYYETDGITISVVGVQMERPSNYKVLEDPSTPYESIGTTSAYDRMLRLTKITHGILHPTNDSDRSQLVTEMREDLKSPMIKATIEEDFSPIVLDMTSTITTNITTVSGVNSNNVLPFKLNGFYGTKVKGSADLLLTGDYNVPLYAQWKYGEGTVGSFMCDLVGDWSAELVSSDDGKILIQNIVRTLTPIKNIRDNDIRLTLTEDNYYNNLSILTDLKEGEYLKGTIYYENEDGSNSISLSNFETNKEKAYTVIACDQDNNYSRSRFVLKDITTYEIEVIKYDANGNKIGSNKIYKSLPYSEEYSLINGDGTEYEEVAKQYARLGNGSYIEDLEDPHEIIDSFDINLITRFDPRILFSILIIVLFLTDFAVRKFKFRWPHEIVRDHKNKKK